MARHQARHQARRLVRPRVALVVTAVAAAGALTSCGFDYSTDQIYNASTGTNHRTGEVSVLSAVVVSSTANQGTFIATFNNNSDSASDTVTGLTAGPSGSPVTVTGFTPLDLAPNTYVNLADSEGVKVTGTFTAGQYVDLTVDLANNGSVDMEVPVVPATNEYAGLDTTATQSASSSPSGSSSAPASILPVSPSGGATASGSPAR